MISNLKVGDVFATLKVDYITKEMVYLIDGLTMDSNPVILEEEFARKMGLDGTAIQGQLILSQFVKMLTDSTSPGQIRSIEVSFRSSLLLGDTLNCLATVARTSKAADGGALAELELRGENQNAKPLCFGRATVAELR